MLNAMLSLFLLCCIAIISFIKPFHASIILLIFITAAGWMILKQKLVVLIGDQCDYWRMCSIYEDYYKDSKCDSID